MRPRFSTASNRKALMAGRSIPSLHGDQLGVSSVRTLQIIARIDFEHVRLFRKLSPVCNRPFGRPCARSFEILLANDDTDRFFAANGVIDVRQFDSRSHAVERKTDQRKVRDRRHCAISGCRQLRHLQPQTSALRHRNFVEQSSVSETRIVSPSPSHRSEPMPIALLIRPSSPSPASVTPR